MAAASRSVPRVTAPQQTLITARALDLPFFTIRQNRKRYQYSVLSAAVTLTLSAHRS